MDEGQKSNRRRIHPEGPRSVASELCQSAGSKMERLFREMRGSHG